ncbi:MAG TPA: hypothetical protein VHT68_26015 [Pseudolabrys sp.]|jgi:hypothetical protein|nr:hypothetical protein [Pseudolabrys sp.]
MASFDESLWRLSTPIDMTCASAGGAANSTAIFSTETYAIQLSFPGSTSSTGGVRVKVITTGDTACSSTGDALLPANWIQYYKVTSGQRVSAISNDAGTPTLNVVQLTK